MNRYYNERLSDEETKNIMKKLDHNIKSCNRCHDKALILYFNDSYHSNILSPKHTKKNTNINHTKLNQIQTSTRSQLHILNDTLLSKNTNNKRKRLKEIKSKIITPKEDKRENFNSTSRKRFSNLFH